MSTHQNEAQPMELDEEQQEEEKQPQPQEQNTLSFGELYEVWLRQLLAGTEISGDFDQEDEDHMRHLRKCATESATKVVEASKQFEQMLLATELMEPWTAALISGTFGTMGNLWDAWTACKTAKEREWMLFHLDNNSWMSCHELGYLKTDFDYTEDAMKQLDEMKEFPISPELSKKLYEVLFE